MHHDCRQHACVCAKSWFSRVWLFAILRTVARQAPLSIGLLQARILEWVAMPFSRGSSCPRDWTHVSYVSYIGRFFTTSITWEALQAAELVLVTQSCSTLWDPMDCSLPGSSLHGILQARILEWVAISFSRESSQHRDHTRVSRGSCIACRFFTTEPLGKPLVLMVW